MMRRLFITNRDATQRTCSLDGCDVVVTGRRMLTPSQIGPCEIWLCETHAAQLQQLRKAIAKAADDIRQFQAEQAAKERDAEVQDIEGRADDD